MSAAAWVLRQLALTRWIDLPFSFDAHSPVHYVRTSEQALAGELPSMKHVRYVRWTAAESNGHDPSTNGDGGAHPDDSATA